MVYFYKIQSQRIKYEAHLTLFPQGDFKREKIIQNVKEINVYDRFDHGIAINKSTFGFG